MSLAMYYEFGHVLWIWPYIMSLAINYEFCHVQWVVPTLGWVQVLVLSFLPSIQNSSLSCKRSGSRITHYKTRKYRKTQVIAPLYTICPSWIRHIEKIETDTIKKYILNSKMSWNMCKLCPYSEWIYRQFKPWLYISEITLPKQVFPIFFSVLSFRISLTLWNEGWFMQYSLCSFHCAKFNITQCSHLGQVWGMGHWHYITAGIFY